MPPSDGFVLGRRPALDGVRCLAISGVLLQHGRVPIFHGAGKVGVTLFFVLSGFLITRLLVEEGERSGRIGLGGFYMRRALRLFPALAALLAVSVAGSLATGKGLGGAQYAVFYIANMARAAGRPMPFLGHTWSLSLEEQFYLVWPATIVIGLVLLRSRRALVWFLIGAILVSMALRLVLYRGPADYDRVYYAPDTRADALLVGCLLALTVSKVSRARFLGALAFLSSCALAWLATFSRGAFFFHVGLALTAVGSAALITYSLNPRGVARSLLTARPVLYIGRISYGIYLYHYAIFRDGRPRMPGPHILTFFICVGISLLVAAVSFRYLETPFLALKRKVSPTR